MKLRWLLPAVGLLLMTAGARAQVGLYITPMGTHVTNSQADTGVFAFLGQDATSRTFGGVGIGAYYELGHDPKVNFAVDMRDEVEHGGGAFMNSFLVGAKVSGKLANPRLKPYVQLSGGLGSTRSPLSVVKADKAMYKVYAGMDIALNPHVDFRALEIGYGTLTTISSALYGGSKPIPAADLLSFASGFVFRFGK